MLSFFVFFAPFCVCVCVKAVDEVGFRRRSEPHLQAFSLFSSLCHSPSSLFHILCLCTRSHPLHCLQNVREEKRRCPFSSCALQVVAPPQYCVYTSLSFSPFAHFLCACERECVCGVHKWSCDSFFLCVRDSLSVPTIDPFFSFSSRPFGSSFSFFG